MEKQYKPVPDVEELRYKGTPEKPDIKIFVSHRIDLDSETIDNPLYIPVLCGAIYDERTAEEIGGMLGDDTGDNISEKRMSFCELTVQYWAWKNVEADYYGLCHYRRYISFADKIFETGKNTQLVHEDYIDEDSINKFGLTEEVMRPVIAQYDMVCSEIVHLDKINDRIENKKFTHYDLYYRGFGTTFTDKYVQLLFDVIADKCPSYLDDAKAYFKQSKAKFCNCYIMKKDLFLTYNEWLFDILFEYEKRLETTNFSMDQIRMPGFMSEALSGIYYFHLLKETKIKILDKQLIWIIKPEKRELLLPAFPENNIPIVLSSSNEYAQNLAVTIESIKENSSLANYYDLIILHSDLYKKNQQLLKTIVNDMPNFSLRFYPVDQFIANQKFIVHDHVKVQTFFRLLIPSILKNYEKVLYLDCDLVVNADIALLYSLEISNTLLACSRDIRMAALYNFPSEEFKNYNDKKLCIKNSFDYFNAGVMLINVIKFRKEFPLEKLIQLATSRDWRFADQDLLNSYCQEMVKFLPLKWNVQISFDETKSEQKAPLSLYTEYLEARQNPLIVHYSGNALPTRIYEIDMFEYYWKYAKHSPYYEYSILFAALQNSHFFVCDNRSMARKIADKLLPKGTKRREFAKKLLPKGSLRWRFLKQIYFIFRPGYRPVKIKKSDEEE